MNIFEKADIYFGKAVIYLAKNPFIFFILCCLLIFSCLFFSFKISTVTGQKSGVIVKCADEGFVFKTHECEIIRGGFNNGSGVNGNSFDFTVSDESIYQKILESMNKNSEVTLKYHSNHICTFTETENLSDCVFADEVTIK